MDRDLLFGAAVLLFCVRDARLLAARRPLLLGYLPMLVGASMVSGVAAEMLSASDAREIMADPRFWLPAAIVHAGLGFRSGRRGLQGKAPDWLSVIPAPVLLVALVGAGRSLLVYWDGGTGLTVGLLPGAVYGCLVVLAALSPLPGGKPEGSLRFASIVHASALLLVPAIAAPERAIATQQVEWATTGLVLGCVAAILTLSVFWHLRRFR